MDIGIIWKYNFLSVTLRYCFEACTHLHTIQLFSSKRSSSSRNYQLLLVSSIFANYSGYDLFFAIRELSVCLGYIITVLKLAIVIRDVIQVETSSTELSLSRDAITFIMLLHISWGRCTLCERKFQDSRRGETYTERAKTGTVPFLKAENNHISEI